MTAVPAIPAIESAFRECFARRDIGLPKKAVASRGRGQIKKAGWSIQYLFGTDERGEYLDYYASHRMTDDRHVRIRVSGEAEELESYRSGYIHHPDIPGDEERAKAEFKAFNQRVTEMLRNKGFGPTTINSALRAGVCDE